MMVELVYDAECPNVAEARSLLITAFAQTGVSARWREWERNAPDSPEHARHYGSPTILVDGKDVGEDTPQAAGVACRMYADAGGKLRGTPTLEAICAALMRATRRPRSAARWSAAVPLPAIGLALAPKLVCPLCFPAYAALWSALGLEFVNYTPYLLPLTAAFLAGALYVSVLQYRRNGRAAPLALGLAASALILIGKFLFDSVWLVGAGIIVLMAAILLGSRIKPIRPGFCPACVPEETRSIQTRKGVA